MIQDELIARIKQKPELRGINPQVIQTAIHHYCRKKKITLESVKPRDIKVITTDIRAELRRLVGRFTPSSQITKVQKNATSADMLKQHASTRDRVTDYPLIKTKINQLHPSSILDIGCGLNPLALSKPGQIYYAADINESDLKIIQDHFKKYNLQGKTFVFDARTAPQTNNLLPKADLALLFQILDLLDLKGHKQAEALLKSLPVQNILISFSTKTLSGKPMNHPQRGWIERLLQRLNYPFTVFKTRTEVFYLAQKSAQ